MLKNQKGYFIAALYLFGISQLAFAVESKEDNACHGVDNDAVKGAAAYGCHNLATSSGSSAIGCKNTAAGMYSTAVGKDNQVNDMFTSAFGYKNEIKKEYGTSNSLRCSTAVGHHNRVQRDHSSAFGSHNLIKGQNSSALGAANYVSGNNSGAWGANLAKENGVSCEDKYKKSKYIIEGNDSYAIGNRNSIASGSDNNFILGNGVSIGKNITKSVVLGDGSTAEESNVVSVGSSSQQRKIVHVADGTAEHDAVNKKQLNAVEEKVIGNTVKISKNTQEIEETKARVTKNEEEIQDNKKEVVKVERNLEITKQELKNEISHVGSLSAALSALHPMTYDESSPNQMMLGLGHYRNKQAVALGVTHYFNSNMMMTAGFALGEETRVKTMANLGFTWKIGKGENQTKVEAPSQMNLLREEVRRLNEESQTREKEKEELKTRVQQLEEQVRMLLMQK